jgi:hypothetical protein
MRALLTWIHFQRPAYSFVIELRGAFHNGGNLLDSGAEGNGVVFKASCSTFSIACCRYQSTPLTGTRWDLVGVSVPAPCRHCWRFRCDRLPRVSH